MTRRIMMLIGIESKRYSWSAVWSKTNKPTSSLSAADWKPTDLLFDLLDEHHHIQHNLDHLNLETRIFEPKEVYHETLSTPPRSDTATCVRHFSSQKRILLGELINVGIESVKFMWRGEGQLWQRKFWHSLLVYMHSTTKTKAQQNNRFVLYLASSGWIQVHTLLLVSDANIPRCGFQSNSTTISSTRKITVSSKRNLSPIQSAQNQQR